MKYANRYVNHPKTAGAKQRQRLILGAAVVVVALVVVAGVLLLGSRPAPFSPLVKGAPGLQIEQTQFDYGTVHFGEAVHTVFHIRNVGDKALEILNQPQVQVVKGCCPPQAQLTARTLWPGEEATLTLHFTMHDGMGGDHEFRIPIQTNDPAQPEKDLIVTSNWIA